MMRMFDPHGLRALINDRSGAIAVLGAVGLMVVTGATFLATDLSRLHIARERVQSAADAAMLAAARELDITEAQAEVAARAVFDANMPDDFLGVTVEDFELTFESQHNALNYSDTVRLIVQARLPLFVASLGDLLRPEDLSVMDLTVQSAAVKQTVGAEIVMVLDNTGSMKGQKIKELRTAATILTETLFQGRETVPNLVVGLVNYASTVNIGMQHAHWLDLAAQASLGTDFYPSAWKGCVMARGGALDETDSIIDADDTTTMLTPFLWRSSYWDNGEKEMLFDDDIEMTNVDCRSDYGDNGSCNIWPDPSGDVDERQSRENAGYGPNLGCPAALTPLTPSNADVVDAISHISNWHRGGTFSNVGLAWGWRMLSPAWQGQWHREDGTAIAGLPYGYDKRFNHKIIVLMTDGDNLIFKHDFTAYGVDGENIPTGGIDDSMGRLCEAIKESGIVIYAVTFGKTNASIEEDFSACASDGNTEKRLAGPFYFDAPSGAELTSAFRNIGGQIQDLRLIQ